MKKNAFLITEYFRLQFFSSLHQCNFTIIWFRLLIFFWKIVSQLLWIRQKKKFPYIFRYCWLHKLEFCSCMNVWINSSKSFCHVPLIFISFIDKAESNGSSKLVNWMLLFSFGILSKCTYITKYSHLCQKKEETKTKTKTKTWIMKTLKQIHTLWYTCWFLTQQRQICFRLRTRRIDVPE